MRILRIRLENLNSLKGAHEIDLTTEPLASAGLLAITGRTGAGKSTIFRLITGEEQLDGHIESTITLELPPRQERW